VQVTRPTPIPPGTPAHDLLRVDVPTRGSYVRDVGQVEAELAGLAAAHPTAARLADVGDSARKELALAGHDVHALVLGTRADDPSVPRVLITAGVHPRETANTSLLLDWARRTLDGAAAGDPARRALLDERTVVLVPLVNPDTHATVVGGLERGEQRSIWRRTNHAHQNYRGRHAASEPEVRAVQDLARAWRPSAVYDLHSPGGVVLVPAGLPDARAAAELVSRATGYAISASDAHWSEPVGGGTVKDWAHDQLGATTLTIETGPVHHQTDAQYADTRARMLPALDALVATVDGRHEPPAAARALANPAAATPFVATEHLEGVVVSTEWPEDVRDVG
jgi:succinylglutamate desuccinylase